MRKFIAAILGATASVLFIGGTAPAQQAGQNLTQEEVKTFFDRMQQDVTDAVDTGNYDRLLEWSQNGIADEANFAVSNEVYHKDERKSLMVLSLNKEDMMQLGRMAAGFMSGMQGQPMKDYSLHVEITGFTPIGPDAAAVTTEYIESGTLAMPQSQTASAGQTDETIQTGSTQAGAQQAETGDAQQASTQPLQIQAMTECNHVIRRGASSDQLVIGLSNCQAETHLQPSEG